MLRNIRRFNALSVSHNDCSCRPGGKFTVSFAWITDSIQKFVDSYARVGARDLETGSFFDVFYKQFVNSSPVVAEKFRITDMDRQRDMLKASLDHMVYFPIDREETEEIKRVAGVHSKSRIDVPHHLYEFMARQPVGHGCTL